MAPSGFFPSSQTVISPLRGRESQRESRRDPGTQNGAFKAEQVRFYWGKPQFRVQYTKHSRFSLVTVKIFFLNIFLAAFLDGRLLCWEVIIGYPSPMQSSPVRIGIIGYRGFGAFCTESFHQEAYGRVVAFAGRDMQAMRETAARLSVPHTYTDWRALVADPEVELVHIVTPPDTHAEMALAALQHGKHVLVEKPLAVTNEEAAAILDAAQNAHRMAGINYVMRYNPLYAAVGEIAVHGWLGALTHVGFENYASDEGLADSHWFWQPQQSGGIFIEHGVHFFDVIGQIIGSPACSVLAQTWQRTDGTNKEDRVQATVTYENGVDAAYYHAFNRPGALERQAAHFAFERGHLTLHGWIPTTLELDAVIAEETLGSMRGVLPALEVTEEYPTGHSVRGHGREYPLRFRIHAREYLGEPTPSYRQAVCDALADMTRAIRIPSHRLRVDAADGASSLRVAIAAQKSARTGQSEPV
jgi:predicted dehydrogenase